MTTFQSLGFAEPILRALKDEGYETPTPIQAKAIPFLKEGSDLLGIAQTGTGKTAAFALPILEKLHALKGRPQAGTARVLVLAPTRELVAQIAESFRTYGRHLRVSVTSVVGGMGYGPQTKALRMGVDVLVATPGRLLDHMDSGNIRLNETTFVVLDEADHMFDLGFVVPIRKILAKLPKERQSLFFSATMPREIAKLASEFLTKPKEVSVAPVATTAERVNQQVWLVDAAAKRGLLVELLNEPEFQRTIVFTRTKRGADRVSKTLDQTGIPSAAIHGNKSQNQRQRALDDFKAGKTRVLVATDIAARGIDIDAVSHVINFELPEVPEQYVHRIGRTARAGASGKAIAFCDSSERGLLKDIERTTRQAIPTVDKRGQKGAEVPAAHLIREEEHRDPRGQRGPRGAGRGDFGGRGKPRQDGAGHRDRVPMEDRVPNGAPRFLASTAPIGQRADHGAARPAPRDDRRGDDRRPQPRGERTYADRPHGDRPQGDRPRGERTFGDRPQGDRPRADHRPNAGAKPGFRFRGQKRAGDSR